MGRAPKTKANHKAAGSYRPDRHGGDEPTPVGQLVKPVSLSPEAAWCWDRIVEQLHANGAAAADLPLVLRLCNWWATAETCQSRIDDGDFEYKDLCAMSMASKHIEKLASMLGLSPVDRARMRIQPKKEDKPKMPTLKLA